jgi:hypothetical protein
MPYVPSAYVGDTQHRTQNTEHGTQNTKHRAQNTKHRTQNTQHGTRNTEHEHDSQLQFKVWHIRCFNSFDLPS